MMFAGFAMIAAVGTGAPPVAPLTLTYIGYAMDDNGTVTYSSPAEGDILIAISMTNYDDAGGWTVLDAMYPNYTSALAYRIIPASPAASYVFGGSPYGGVIVCYRPSAAISAVTSGVVSRCKAGGTAAKVGTDGSNVVVVSGQVGNLGDISFTGATSNYEGNDAGQVFQWGFGLNDNPLQDVAVAISGTGFYDVPLCGCCQVNIT